MDMQDKNIDELFRSKLYDYEIIPSNGVWESLHRGLKTARRKSILLPFVSAAACIILLITAGVLLVPQTTKTGIKRSADSKNPAIARQPVAKTNDSISKGSVAGSPTPALSPAPDKTAYGHRNKVKQLFAGKHRAGMYTEENDEKEAGQQLTLASLGDDNEELKIIPIVHDEGAETAVVQNVQPVNSLIPGPRQITVELPDANKINSPLAKPIHKMHSLGDFINAVVAKVDKRKDKIIEFTDTDEESLITGVNIGIIKIKKKEETTDK